MFPVWAAIPQASAATASEGCWEAGQGVGYRRSSPGFYSIWTCKSKLRVFKIPCVSENTSLLLSCLCVRGRTSAGLARRQGNYCLILWLRFLGLGAEGLLHSLYSIPYIMHCVNHHFLSWVLEVGEPHLKRGISGSLW